MYVTRYGVPFPPVYTLSLVGVFLAADLRIFDNGSREGLGPMPLLDALENPRGNKCFDLSAIERRFNPLLARTARNVQYFNEMDRIFRIALRLATENVASQRGPRDEYFYLSKTVACMTSSFLKISIKISS